MFQLGEGETEEYLQNAARVKKLYQNPNLRRDPFDLVQALAADTTGHFGILPLQWNDGRIYTDSDTHDGAVVLREKIAPLLEQAIAQCTKSARKELFELTAIIQIPNLWGGYAVHHGTERNVEQMRACTTRVWGDGSNVRYVETVKRITFQRHHVLAKKFAYNYCMILQPPAPRKCLELYTFSLILEPPAPHHRALP